MTNRTVTRQSKDVVLIRCSATDAARIMNSLKINADNFLEDKTMTLFAKSVGTDMLAFAHEIAAATGETL